MSKKLGILLPKSWTVKENQKAVMKKLWEMFAKSVRTLTRYKMTQNDVRRIGISSSIMSTLLLRIEHMCYY